MNRVKCINVMCAFAVCLAIFAAGCSVSMEARNTAGAGSAVLEKALDDIKPALVQMDRRYALYEDALDAVSAYVASPGAATLAAAGQSCSDAIAGIGALPDVTSGLTDGDREALVNIGLNLADYGVPFEYEASFRADYIDRLNAFSRYLGEEPVDLEMVGRMIRLHIRMDDVFRQTDYIGLNMVFCAFSGPEIDVFRDEFLPTLKALSADGLPWDTDAAALEAKANKLLDDVEADIDAYAAFVGERYRESPDQK